jgi:hypothetical protein
VGNASLDVNVVNANREQSGNGACKLSQQRQGALASICGPRTPEDPNGYFASDATVHKLSELFAQPSKLGDSVWADERDSKPLLS